MKKLLPILPILALFIGCSYDEPNGWLWCTEEVCDVCELEGVEECCPECDEDGAYLRGCHACFGQGCEECPTCPECPECPPPEQVYLCKHKVKICDKWGSYDCQYVWQWECCTPEEIGGGNPAELRCNEH